MIDIDIFYLFVIINLFIGGVKVIVQNKLKNAYKNQFNKYYGRKLSEEQLKVYMDFFLRKELDANRVSSVCNIPFNESFSDRETFARHFKFIYDFEPNEDQLDMFISFSLCVPGITVSDVCEVVEVRSDLKNPQPTEPSNN